ncbi:MAG: PAS domain-containing protein [Gemmataceae bacterium]|nr:PAS domain-containing protein [Gemmataceae bacterium]
MIPVATAVCLDQPEQMLLDHLTQSVFLKDREGRFVAVNQAFCEGLGRNREEILGRDDFAFYPRVLAEKYRADDARILEEGVPLETEEQNIRNGQWRTVRVVKSPVRGPDGSIQGILGIFWDITEQRQLEAQLRQAQKMTAIAQLAGAIAHDFNNLLTGIAGNLSLACIEIDHLALPVLAHVRRLLSNAEQTTQRAADLTRQLLLFARRLQPQPAPLAVNDLLCDILQEQPLPETIKLSLSLDPALGVVEADAGQLRQAIRHLLIRAREAMPQGGVLTIQTNNVTLVPEAAAHRAVPAERSTIILPPLHADARIGDFVRLRIADTGISIAPDVLDHLFEPFFATKGLSHGTGLGLAIAASIAKDHDGWLECHSGPAEGTRFDLYLPRRWNLATTLG